MRAAIVLILVLLAGGIAAGESVSAAIAGLRPALAQLRELRAPAQAGDLAGLRPALEAWDGAWRRHERVVDRDDWAAYGAIETAAAAIDMHLRDADGPAAAAAIGRLVEAFAGWADRMGRPAGTTAVQAQTERPHPLRRWLATFASTAYGAASWIVLGFLIAGIVHIFVPRDALLRWLGGGGPMPVLRAVTCGLALPICSCGVVPIAIGLHRQGAPPGPVLAFLVSAPALSPVTAVAMWTLLGPVFAIVYTVTVLGASVVIAVFARFLPPSGSTASIAAPAVIAAPACRPTAANLRRALAFAFHDYGAEVSLDILFGLLLASAAVALVPPELIVAAVGSSSTMTYALIALVATPIYVCTLPSIPIMANLIAVGMVPGAAITYLMAGSGTNFGEVLAIARRISRAAAALFVIVTVSAAWLAGLVADRWHLLPVPAVPEPAAAFIPALFGLAAGDCPCAVATPSLLGTVGAACLAYILGRGICVHLRQLWLDPCAFCRFWAGLLPLAAARACTGPCWLVRLRRVLAHDGGSGTCQGGMPETASPDAIASRNADVHDGGVASTSSERDRP